MADAILYGVVQTIIESLGSSTLNQIGSIWGVNDELEKMKNTISTIQSVLEDAEEQQIKNHQVKNWLMKLRDEVFDADDLLSEFSTYLLQREVMDGDKTEKKVHVFFSISNPVVFGFKMAHKLRAMRETFNDIANDRINFQLVDRPLLVTRTVTMGRVQSAMSDYGNWVSNGTILDSPVSISSLFPAYESETDVSSVNQNGTILEVSISSLFPAYESETDASSVNQNGTILDSPVSISSLFPAYKSETDVSSVFSDSPPRFSHSNSNMSIFSPTISETGSPLSNGPTHSIPLLFPANKSETDSGSESNETPPQFSYPMMSIFPPNSSQTDNSGNYEIIPTDPSIPHFSEKKTFGRKQDKKAITNLLLAFDVEENVSFISIVGIGGLGKTTLAQYVYNDEKVKTYFELKMWVCVSDTFDVKIIVERIIASATGTKPKNLEMERLQNELRNTFNQKKYLLVLDDVWTENDEDWCNLKTLLLSGARGSKVVITTRSKLVAKITSTITYVLRGLPNDKSWFLLKQMAFDDRQDTIDPDLEAIGMDIVEYCQGLPLSIKMIGRVLYFKTTKVEWLDIKNELGNVTQLKDGPLPILKLSYNHLLPHLKCCFAYCSLFPKDYLIDKLTLIQLWIAQGFIQSPNENLLLEDVANEYFMDLLWRSFFQEVEEDRGMNRRFKMHNLIHDLAQYVSRTDCTLVDYNAKKVNEKGRHLSFSFYNVSFFEENLSTLVKANKIRTFILAYNNWNFDQGTIEELTLKKLISTCRYVRVLDLHGLKMKMLPNTIGTLMHLKYLDLSFNDIEVLPSSITRLVTLQTLKLSWCAYLRELPENIQKLVSLRHLHIDGCENLTHMPRGLGQLTSLQTLTLFVVSKGPVGSSKHCIGLAELKKLNDLGGKLEIKNLARLRDATSEFKAANLKHKQRLNELELDWNPEGDDGVDASDDENSMDSLQPHDSLKSLNVKGYMGVRVSSWLSFLTNLVDLMIFNCKKCQYLPPLYQLPTLQKLIIWRMDGLEYMTDEDMNDEISASLATPSTFFPSLETLSLEECQNLKGWWRRDKGNEATTT